MSIKSTAGVQRSYVGVAGAPVGGVYAGLTTTLLCVVAAMLEGIDLQTTGLAASRLARTYQLSHAMTGVVLSAGVLGLLPGAMIGGRLADKFGFKGVLVVAVALFGVFSLITPAAFNLSSLVVLRFLTGVGLGGALPNLIALTAKASAPANRSRAISTMYAGLPLGGALISLVAVLGGQGLPWQNLFYIGGVTPLFAVPALVFGLREPTSKSLTPTQDVPSFRAVLFRGNRALSTVLLWAAYFLTLAVVYLLLNWLPSLFEMRGFSHSQTGFLQIVFNLAGAIGSVSLGVALDRSQSRAVVGLVYVGMVLALFALGHASGLLWTGLATFAAGLFAIGGQLILYATAPRLYDQEGRGTGIGFAVGIGRLGAVCGPIAAGAMLGASTDASGVLLMSAPGVLLAGGCLFWLFGRLPLSFPERL